jgi:aerobic carbon-monoxide dehydrogenase small subunit
MPDKLHLRLFVNGQLNELEAYGMARLLDILREDLRLTGVKEGCGEGECGACSVLLNGELVNSCLIPALQVDGASVTTIEGLPGNRTLDSVQAAFLDHGGTQCGICTPGMILAAVYLLEKFPDLDEERIREGLAGNLCRCTGYQSIIEAIKHAVPEAQQS